MFTLFFRGAILYIAMIITMRALGKRQLGEFQPYELAMTILLADVISAPMESVATPLMHGLLPVAAMFTVHGIISLASMKWDRFRAIVSGKPTVVVTRGKIDQRELDRLCLSLSDLLEGLRGAGFMNPSEVGTAVVEANGSISAFADGSTRSPRNSEMNIDPGYEGLPLMLVTDGKIQPGNLARSGQDEAWLRNLLSSEGHRPEDIYLAVLDTQGVLTLQLRRGDTVRIQAMDPSKVVW
ncbi:MAG: DUF421 domain-containing protein [Clostridiales bacterium]|nr:DUF421 domain-containing protein [Clostridiales bacterium]